MSGLDAEVLVVGAGPAGSALSAALARAGRSVILVEAQQHPRPKACAEYASPRIVEELRRIGLRDARWQPDARPLRGMRVIRGDDAVEIGYRDPAGRPRMAWGLDRERFDATLAVHAAASGADLHERTRFEEVTWSDGRVSGAWVRGTDGRRRRLRTSWVVGADGARSRVARSLGVERPVIAPRRLGLLAHVAGATGPDDAGEMHVGRGFYVGLAPLRDGLVNVGMALPLSAPVGAESRFDAAIRALPAVAQRLAGAERVTAIRGAAPIGHRVSRAAGPGWMLVGDAAGFVDPFTGEGIHRALRSARAAAEALLHEGSEAADQRYLVSRHAAFAAKSTLTWAIQGMLAAGPLMGYALRRLEARPRLARVLGDALGDCRPATDALSPAFLAALLRP